KEVGVMFKEELEEFKKFGITQNEKVSGKDKEIAQLLKTDANIKEVTKVLIEQECGCQNYGTQELINKIPNLKSEEQNNSKRLEIKAEEITEPEQYVLRKKILQFLESILEEEILIEQNKYKAVAKNIPKSAIETILLRQLKQHKMVEKDEEYSTNTISINIHEWIATTKQEEKLKECKKNALEAGTKI
ncbi:5285_t:CDS:2, partial [Gigaspora margarita]